ncbi:MAG TPA: tetratricopeptide repeat protein [Candidatus Paceibacterota bacterium]
MSRPRFLKTSYYELCHIWHNPRLPILAALIGTALIVGGATVFTLYHDAFARKAWYQFRAPRMALVLDFSDAKLASDIGNYYFNGGAYDLKIAERAYKKALSIKPDILWGHYQLARIYFVYGDFEGALAETGLELAANPENLRTLYVRGLIYGYRGRPGDLLLAEADFRRFTLWAPSEWAGYNDLAWILSKEAKYQDAKDAMLVALARVADAEKNPWLWNAKGVAELNLGEYKKAAESFGRALALAEGLTEADWRRSYPGNNPGGAEAGLSAFKEAIQSNLARAVSFLQ